MKRELHPPPSFSHYTYNQISAISTIRPLDPFPRSTKHAPKGIADKLYTRAQAKSYKCRPY